MRIVFVGAVDFSLHCLREVCARGGDVVAVLTLGPEQAGRHSDYADLAPEAAARGITVHRIGRIGDPAVVELIASLRPDVMFVFGFSQLVPRAVLSIPPKGCIGSHPALRPRHRGRHPLIWALVEGFTESGLTFFYLDEGVRRVLCYESLSSTDAAAPQPSAMFVPTVYHDITPHLERKLAIMALYATEAQADPLPRGPQAIRALARFRGATVGLEYAEAFMLVREVS